MHDTIKTTPNVTKLSLDINSFLNPPASMIKFFKSSIGPINRNPATPLKEYVSKKLFPTNASASEHKDNQKPKNIINTMASTLFSVINANPPFDSTI